MQAHVIGLTEKEITACPGVDTATSESGLYLDKLPGMGADWFAPSGNYGMCEDTRSYITRLSNARNEALSLTKEAILHGLSSSYTLKKHAFSGYIGQRQGTGLSDSDTFTIKTKTNTDAYLHITQIGVLASGTGTATVQLTSDNGLNESFEIDVTTTGVNVVDAALKLPLDGTVYTFTTTTTGTVQLQKNAIGCGCGQKDTVMYSYMGFGSSYASGITLTTRVTCTVSDFFSRSYAVDENTIAVFARMVYYKAGTILCDYVMGDVQPQDSDTDIDYVKARRAYFEGEFDTRLQWLLESGLDITDSACFECLRPRLVTIG